MFRHFFAAWLPTPKSQPRAASRQSAPVLPLFQPLESRRLLSAALQPWAESSSTVSYPSVSNVNEPGPGNTGPVLPSTPKQCGSFTVTTPNAVIQNVAVTGMVVIDAPNVTLRNFTINADGDAYGIWVVNPYNGTNSVTATDGEITNASEGGIFGNNWTAIRLNIHDMGCDATDGGGNNLLMACWIHQIGSLPGAHADGFQAVNGTNMVLEGNNFDIPWTSQIGGTTYNVNSCIFLNGSLYGAQYLNGTVIDGNWLDGGNYEIYSLQQTGTVVTNNVFGNDSQWGDLYGSVDVWKNNIG